MNTNVLNIPDPLTALAALANQIFAEVDAVTKGVEEERFSDSQYQGKRLYYHRGSPKQRNTFAARKRPDSKLRWQAIRKHNLSLAQPGEMLLGDWLKLQCKALRQDRSWVMTRLNRGDFPQVTVRRVNLRLVFVSVKKVESGRELRVESKAGKVPAELRG